MTAADATHHMLPKASGIDYTNIDEIYGYFHLLLMHYQHNGGLSFPRKTTKALTDIDSENKYWLLETKHIMPSAPLTWISRCIEGYDLLHRIYYGEIPTEFTKSVVARTVKRWLAGDKSVSETEIATIVDRQRRCNVKSLDYKYLSWLCSVEEKWIKELERHGKFRDIPMSEAYNRLRILTGTDLRAYYGDKKAQDNIKRKWAKTYMVDNLSRLDYNTLRSYISYRRDAPHTPKGDSSNSTYARLVEELVARKETHPFEREAFKMSIKYLQQYAD